MEPRSEVSPHIADHLKAGLYTSIPIFIGGVLNTIAVAAVAAARHPTELFIAWLAIEILLGATRFAILMAARRIRARGGNPPTVIIATLSCMWSASVGFGAFISIVSQDWVLAIIACLSAAGMISGICLRNFGTPRLVLIMMMLSLVPCAIAVLLTGEAALLIVAVQLPILMAVIGAAAFRLNALMVERMVAQDALSRSEAFNRSILESSPDYTLLLDENHRIIFCNRPQARHAESGAILGGDWLDMLPDELREDGRQALGRAFAGETTRLTVAYSDAKGRRWFDLALSPVTDGSRRVLLVARDITHQKSSEERAVWMANHDPLTGLPNRILIQAHLDSAIQNARLSGPCALLMLDIDNFKLINDTLGHDAGDALLCAFANRLTSAVRRGDLVGRLGGDEFAIVLGARSEEEVESAADRIFAQLDQPFLHDAQLIECNASIGAALHPRDGADRPDLMKAADIALYSAKAAGRGQLKIFESAMRNEVQVRSSMAHLARTALGANDLMPYYQPKVSLRTGDIVGFEALLRWRDAEGRIRPPSDLMAAFDDPVLSAAISDRILQCTLADMRRWLDAGIEFGHVAINAAPAAFRSGKFADQLLGRLHIARIPTHRLQIEVTETVFLGRGSDHVKRSLQRLNSAGIRIALDDFGTGHASLAHLMQFPVDALKIDRSFIRQVGRNGGAEAITKAIVNLGHGLDIEIVAEGVETAEQAAYLSSLGCHTGQGYLYSRAVPASTVAGMVEDRVAKSA